MERFTGKDIGLLLAGGAGAVIGMTVADQIRGTNHTKLEVLPRCQNVRTANEALVPVSENQITQQIGRTAVCKIDDQVFRIVLSEQR